jgi:hypothetical protein
MNKPRISRSHRYRRMSSQSECYHQNFSSSNLLILIRLIILLSFSLIIYYTFVYIYPKPKQNGWERLIDWLIEE